MKKFLTTYASGISLIITGGVLYLLNNHTEGIALLSAGLGSFGIKISATEKKEE